eukprot:CAMPEP_0176462744 /NCGR_PEP_ID=MMETSP0127-20121128/35464_1 /TAXON_ID=938130 /ORGANISM="Platyophrya macrostoma, Strain WH" /LENGTH=130 /DNA_ID=CAMNT_0017854749 /DNA_START=162 /DNA_END=551 /DNA_ORIENTATION=-
MKEKLIYYNENKEGKIEKLKDATYQAKEVMVQSVDEILDRGRKIELLVKKTQNLDNVASGLQQRADQYRSQEKWKSIRLKLVLAAIVGVGIYILVKNENKEGKIEKLKDATYQAKEVMVQSVDEILDRGR